MPPVAPLPIRIAPSILSADFGRLADEVRAIEQAGADYVHVDVMDGRFVPNLTIGPVVVAAVKRATQLPLDVHLMIEEPERYVDDFVRAGASFLTVHVEACRHLHRVLQQIRHAGARPQVVINPATPVSAIEDVVDDVELVLVMSVNPGFGGQAFIPRALDKIRALRALLDARGRNAVEIEVDGGVKVDNVDAVARAGANVIVSGSGIFEKGADYADRIAKMRARAEASV